jgi:hypothetical protein
VISEVPEFLQTCTSLLPVIASAVILRGPNHGLPAALPLHLLKHTPILHQKMRVSPECENFGAVQVAEGVVPGGNPSLTLRELGVDCRTMIALLV